MAYQDTPPSAHRTMREFLTALESCGRLRRITKPVDRLWEPATLAKWMYQALPEAERFGMVFENVIGSTIPIVTGALGASRDTYALALNVPVDDINDAWVHACCNPIAPREVASAPCHDVVLGGPDAKLGLLPIPVWTPGKDAAPYITTIVITRHHDSGVQNMGVYRTQVRDDHSVIVNFSPNRQGTVNIESWTNKGKPAPVAWVIAAQPAVHLATLANLPANVDELFIAGGMIGEPVEVVRTKTNALLVPASAEIIVEGLVHPGEMQKEGPFGEFAGYMGPVEDRPVARITAITHRRDPIYYGYTSQMPPSESVIMQSLTNAGYLMKVLRVDLGEASVADVAIDQTFGGLLGHGIVAMTPRYPAHGKKVGRLLAEISPLKRVTVVDADVDIRDPQHIDWALNARFNPARDTVIIDDVFFPIHMDPSIRSRHAPSTMGSKIVIDATSKNDAGPLSLPAKEIMERGLESWRAAGLPPFEIPRRAKQRIEKA